MKTIRKSATLLTGVIAAALLVLTGCSAAPSGDDATGASGTLKVGTTTEVVSYTPLNTVSITDMWVMGQLYPTLFVLDDKGALIPQVADSYELSDDGSTVTLKLNEDYKWSDGKPLTAADIEFTLDRLASDKLISGASYIGNYDGATIVSDSEIELHMKKPSRSWAQDIAQSLGVIPKHVFEDVPNLAEFSIEQSPEKWVSGGSFVLTKIVPGQRYIFEPNEHYPLRAEGNEAVTGLEFQIYGDINTMQLALQNGDIDIAAPNIPSSAISSLGQQDGIKIVETDKALNYSKLTFNAKEGPLNDPVVRQTISGLIDTEGLVNNVLQGHATEVVGPILPAQTEFLPTLTPWKTTPEAAKKTLADAGYSDLSLKLVCDQGNASHAKSAQLIRDALTPAGINVNLACAERATSIASAKAGDFDLYIHKLNYLYSPGSNLLLQFHPSNPSGLNYNFTEDAKAGELMDATASAVTEDDYVSAVKDAATYVHDQAYVVPLYDESINIAYNDSRFDGYLPTGLENSTMVNPYSLAQVTASSK